MHECLLLCSRLEVQAGELAKESAQRETGSLGAGSDCASTRGMAGSIISSYTLPDRWEQASFLPSFLPSLLTPSFLPSFLPWPEDDTRVNLPLLPVFWSWIWTFLIASPPVGVWLFFCHFLSSLQLSPAALSHLICAVSCHHDQMCYNLMSLLFNPSMVKIELRFQKSSKFFIIST